MTSFLLRKQHPHATIRAMAHARQRLLVHVNKVADVSDECFCHAFVGLIAAVESAFCQEEILMEAAAYPGLHEQRQDNALLLQALHRAAVQVEAGDIALGREVTAALPGLLSLHRLSALRLLRHDVRGQRAGVVLRNGRLRIYTGSRRRTGEVAR